MIKHADIFTQLALISDSLSLGSHWIYDQEQIKDEFAQNTLALHDPLSSYHPNRKAGQFTHYGDQTVTVYHSLTKNNGWNGEDYLADYQAMWQNYDGYIDGATKTTLLSLNDDQSPKSHAPDLAGVTRIAPFLRFLESDGLYAVLAWVHEFVALTHDDPFTLEVAEFIVRSVDAIEATQDLESGLRFASETHSNSVRFLETLSNMTSAAASPVTVNEFAQNSGLACQTTQGFPIVLFIALRSPSSLSDAILANNFAGGENAARVGLLSMLLTPLTESNDDLFDFWKSLSIA